ncbi:DUF6452 family protein [Chryseolinea soli]|uniref:Uncharacterized protein n=1 Tax=Chryseolinea soli TaxID=2321403 RepID=A0A385SN11_9BACT|nr:DUF6452 family protein [Chryseolinea soli]AYB30830.1 hypothetical protein D4L85_09685 [Chryseolinea soli]
MKKAIWFTFLAAIAISCLDNPDCFRLTNSEFGINFRVMGFGADEKTLDHAEISGTNITVVSTIASSIGLPLDPLSDTLQYVFHWTDGRKDSFLLGYNAKIQFVSADCGERHVFDGLDVRANTFDSLSIYSTKPTNPSSVNIQIFRCAHPDFFGVSFKHRLTSTTTEDSLVAIQSITSDFDAVITLPNDTLSSVYLPLNKKTDHVQYVFDFGSVGTRVLDITYTRQRRLWAVDACDTTTLFTALKVAKTTTLVGDTLHYKFLNKNTIDPAILNLETILN